MAWAKYTVEVVRELGESDGGGIYHDGSKETAIHQLAAELQEAWDSGAVEGFFRVIDREETATFPWEG